MQQDSPPFVLGGNSTIARTSSKSFDKVCIRFKNTDKLIPQFKRILKDGERLCNSFSTTSDAPTTVGKGTWFGGDRPWFLGGSVDSKSVEQQTGNEVPQVNNEQSSSSQARACNPAEEMC
jgi:hypothetical protein